MTPALIIQLNCGCCLTEYPDATLEIVLDDDCGRTSHFDVQGWPNIIDAAKAEILWNKQTGWGTNENP